MSTEDEITILNDGFQVINDLEIPEKHKNSQLPEWKLIVADDDESVHSATRLALEGFEFNQRNLKIIHTYSAEETYQALLKEADIAVILLDVVMESEDAGLKLVKRIREDLGNQDIRIILRTGQPGQAPAWEVINQYEINDYKNKTELTQEKLFTALATAMRSYEQISVINGMRVGLEMIVDATESLDTTQSLTKFASGLLIQLNAIKRFGEENVMAICQHNDVKENPYVLKIFAGTGEYLNNIGALLQDVVDASLFEAVLETLNKNINKWTGKYAILPIRIANNNDVIIILETQYPLEPQYIIMLQVFCNKISIAFDNIHLHNELIEQKKLLEMRVRERTQDLITANKDLQKLAMIDPLTSIFNRRYFIEVSEKEISRSKRYNSIFSIMMFDIDHFKQINDEYGHNIGDDILVDLSLLCLGFFRANDVFARYGGEEFIVLMPETNLQSAHLLADRLCKAISQSPYDSDDQKIEYTVSIGVTNYDLSDMTINDTVERADKAMYDAKHKGRNQVVCLNTVKEG